MRLLGSADLTLYEFPSDAIPRYAILSHTWGNGEVTLQELNGGGATGKAGFEKITGAASRAKEQQIPYIWIDTCCIDKTSSSELSESINSMFKWYRNAQVCYAYLSDVSNTDDVWNSDKTGSVQRSRWVTRGWTLQELIAPTKMEFLSKDWALVGTKLLNATSLASLTGVDRDVLVGITGLSQISIARRMSWASARTTTRTEDVAYCLMGLFDINMALLYGEGSNAFARLQLEIIRTSNDRSIFAWMPSERHQGRLRGVLAASPNEFAYAADIRFVSPRQLPSEELSYSMTNMGIQIRMPLSHTHTNANMTEFDNRFGTKSVLAILDCYTSGDPRTLAITIAQVSGAGDQLFRVVYDRQPHQAHLTFMPINEPFPDRQTVFLGLNSHAAPLHGSDESRTIVFNLHNHLNKTYGDLPVAVGGTRLTLSQVYPAYGWSAADSSIAIHFRRVRVAESWFGNVGFLFSSREQLKNIALICGVGRKRNVVWKQSWRRDPWCKLLCVDSKTDLREVIEEHENGDLVQDELLVEGPEHTVIYKVEISLDRLTKDDSTQRSADTYDIWLKATSSDNANVHVKTRSHQSISSWS